MRIRTVHSVIHPQSVLEGAGVKLKRSIATPQLDYLDPFLLFDHFGSHDPEDYIRGFPMHPHRGIETVTYMLAGSVRHKDSIGNAGSLGAGDVQWMTSGRGILHEEMPTPVDGRMEGFQLWVNLPAKIKMSQPRYQEFAAAKIPEYRRENGTKVRVIAGTLDGIRGAVTDIAVDPTYIDVSLPSGTRFDHSVPAGHAAFLYLFEGEAWIGESSGGSAVTATQMVILDDGDAIQVTTSEQAARFLLVSGKPLNEPIARYGPFVMNTKEEIAQALEDLRRGTFVK